MLRAGYVLRFCVFCTAIWSVSAAFNVQAQGGSGREWTWLDGESTVPQVAVYPSAFGGKGEIGGRMGAYAWLDAGGNVCVFGGTRQLGPTSYRRHSDVWKFSSIQKDWTWVAGPTGTAAISYPASVGGVGQPGQRRAAAVCPDGNGDLWLFGGFGPGTSIKNDLWKFDASANEWRWIAGSKEDTVHNSLPANIGDTGEPSGRTNSIMCATPDGGLMIFGGATFYQGEIGVLRAEVWKYDISANSWTWLGNYPDTVYPAAPGEAGVPGFRYDAAMCHDLNGNLWLYGGSKGDDPLGDLWQFDVRRGEWLWMNGGKNGHLAADFPASYGEAGFPGKRSDALLWSTPEGVWLYGGNRVDGPVSEYGEDLWRLNLASNQWTWEGGARTFWTSADFPAAVGGLGSPGTLLDASTWADAQGNLWLFGGAGTDPLGNYGEFNTVWRLTLNSNTAAAGWDLFQ